MYLVRRQPPSLLKGVACGAMALTTKSLQAICQASESAFGLYVCTRSGPESLHASQVRAALRTCRQAAWNWAVTAWCRCSKASACVTLPSPMPFGHIEASSSDSQYSQSRCLPAQLQPRCEASPHSA